MDFSISVDGLASKGNEIAKQSTIIKEALNDINEARSSLGSWVSVNKDKFDNRLASSLPQIKEITDTIDTFSSVALQTSSRIQTVENKIANAANDNFVG